MKQIFEKHLFILITVILSTFSCNNTNNNKSIQVKDQPVVRQPEQQEVKSVLNSKDLLKARKYFIDILPEDTNLYQNIHTGCAVLVYPDSTYIANAKNELGEENFYTIADDNQWYQAQAIGILDTLGIKIITAKKKILNFKGDFEDYGVDLNKSKEGWMVFLFNPRREPFIVSTVDTKVEEYKKYMGIK